MTIGDVTVSIAISNFYAIFKFKDETAEVILKC